MFCLAAISASDAAVALGGALTTGGSIFAVLALLNRPGKEALNSVAVVFLGLGAVLLLWPDAEERGLDIYWIGLTALAAVALGLTVWLRFTPQGRKEISKFEDQKPETDEEAGQPDGDDERGGG
jgi:hypothetical protein